MRRESFHPFLVNREQKTCFFIESHAQHIFYFPLTPLCLLPAEK